MFFRCLSVKSQLIFLWLILFALLQSGVSAETPIFSNDKYTFYADRMESKDYYPGVFRSTDGLTITKDGARNYTWNKARLDKMYLQTPYPILDAAFVLAVRDALDHAAPAGTKSSMLDGDVPGGQYYWPYYYVTHHNDWSEKKEYREYTRDSAQHIEWGDSIIINRDAAKGSLIRRCNFEKKMIREDFVVTADVVHFIPAAWMFYKVTGDRDFLQTCFECMWNTLNTKEKTHQDKADGLWTGSPWSDNKTGFVKPEHFEERNTSVKSIYGNTMVAGAWLSIAQIAKVLDKSSEASIAQQKYEQMKKAINTHLYRPELGTYCYYKYEPTDEFFDYREPITAGLIYLYGIADEPKAMAYHQKLIPTPYGYRNVDPPTPAGQSTYHGGNPWANLDPYHGWMLSRLKHPDKLKPFIFWWARAGLPLKQWREGTRDPDTGQFHDNYKHLIWGSMGYVSYWSRGVLGIIYEPDGIRFEPCVPADFGNDFYAILNNFEYRESSLRIILTGKGTELQCLELDGKTVDKIPADLKGRHTVNIIMKDSGKPLLPKPH